MAASNGGSRNPQKGKRVERGLVNELKALGLNAERIPLSGSCGGAFSGDVVIRLHRELRTEVKSRKGGKGFTQLEKWLGKNDLLVLKRDRQKPMILMPWDVFVELSIAACGLGVLDGRNRGVFVDEEGNEDV